MKCSGLAFPKRRMSAAASGWRAEPALLRWSHAAALQGVAGPTTKKRRCPLSGSCCKGFWRGVARVRSVRVYHQPVRLRAGEGLATPCLGRLQGGPRHRGGPCAEPGCSVPPLTPPPGFRAAPQCMSCPWAMSSPHAGSCRASLGTPRGGNIGGLWAMPCGKRLPSAECLALKTPLLASTVLLLLAAPCPCPCPALGPPAVLEWGWQEAARGQRCPLSWWTAPEPQQGVILRHWDSMAGCLGACPPRGQRSHCRGSPALRCSLSWLLTTSSLLLPGTTVCPPCDNEMKSEAIVEHLCASEFGKEERWGHGEAVLGGAGQCGSCVGRILDHCLSLLP